MGKLNLPCRLELTSRVKVGEHNWDWDLKTCYIAINPVADFRVPAHLILHEAAHHRAIKPFLNEDRPDITPCGEYGGRCGHCHHWAQILCDIYREVEIALPYSTGFENFARVAGIKYKLFDPNINNQMLAVEKNVRVIEGA
jgi:hypothetical protein